MYLTINILSYNQDMKKDFFASSVIHNLVSKVSKVQLRRLATDGLADWGPSGRHGDSVLVFTASQPWYILM